MRKPPIIPLVGLCVGLLGCGPSDPLELRVDSTTPISLDLWESGAGGRLSPEQMADFREAFQEIKFEIMAEGTATGSTAVELEALAEIDGKTVREVLARGLYWKLQRLVAERTERLQSINSNARLRTRAGDTDSQSYLEHLHDHLVDVVDEEAGQIAQVERRLVAAGLPRTPPPGSGPTPVEAAAADEGPVLLHR